MALRKEQHKEIRNIPVEIHKVHPVTGETTKVLSIQEREVDVYEVVYDLKCKCGNIGGEIRFNAEHGRESDEVLEKELDETYQHECETCAVARSEADKSTSPPAGK